MNAFCVGEELHSKQKNFVWELTKAILKNTHIMSIVLQKSQNKVKQQTI